MAKGTTKYEILKDGNAWCAISEGFINLQESDNYAFGNTPQEALQNLINQEALEGE